MFYSLSCLCQQLIYVYKLPQTGVSLLYAYLCFLLFYICICIFSYFSLTDIYIFTLFCFLINSLTSHKIYSQYFYFSCLINLLILLVLYSLICILTTCIIGQTVYLELNMGTCLVMLSVTHPLHDLSPSFPTWYILRISPQAPTVVHFSFWCCTYLYLLDETARDP